MSRRVINSEKLCFSHPFSRVERIYESFNVGKSQITAQNRKTHIEIRSPIPISAPSLSPLPTNMKAADALPRVDELKKTCASLADTFLAVSRETGTSVAALRVAYNRAHTSSPTDHGNAKLSAEEDTTLVGLAQAFSINNMALSSLQVRQSVERKWGKEVSASWEARWIGRHKKELSKRTCKALSNKWAGSDVMQSVQDFCDELQELLTTRHFTPQGVINYDETWLVNKGGAMVTRRIHSASKEPSNAHSTRHSTVASLLTFLAANGNIFIGVYVMKGTFVDGGEAEVDFRVHAAPRVSRRSRPRFYCWTETGFLDADTFNHVMDQVTSEWAIRNPSTNFLLFGDRLGAHMRPDTLEKALDR